MRIFTDIHYEVVKKSTVYKTMIIHKTYKHKVSKKFRISFLMMVFIIDLTMNATFTGKTWFMEQEEHMIVRIQ